VQNRSQKPQIHTQFVKLSSCCNALPYSILAGYIPYTGSQSSPLTLATEFKRPTPLPARLQAVVVDGSAKAGSLPLRASVLTANGEKEVIVGTLSNA
jgi:hypothetical protein